MANLTLRSVKGAPLTNLEVDGNFTALNTELQAKQDTLVSGTNVKTINGNSIVGSGDLTVTGIPSQTGNSGKFLTTNGTAPFWGSLNLGTLSSQNSNNVEITGGIASLKSLDLFFNTGASQLRVGKDANNFWDISRDNNSTGDLIISQKNGANVVERIRINSNGAIGLSGSNFGSSGQMLTSSGNGASPSWQTPTIPWTSISGTPSSLIGYGILDAQSILVSGSNIKTINGQEILGSGNLSIDAGATINDDTTTNSSFYPVFTNSISGVLSAARVSSTKLSFNPSTGQFNATIFNSTSDERLKENIEPITSGLNIIESLSGKTFNFKGAGTKSSGFIAQEIRKIIPEVVSSQENGYLSVNYDAIIPYLVEAVKELSTANKELKAEISALKGE